MEKKQVLTSIGLLFPSSVFLPLPSPSSSFNLFSNTLAAEEVRRRGKMIGGRLTHLLADALLIPGSHHGEKWRFVCLDSRDVRLHRDELHQFMYLISQHLRFSISVDILWIVFLIFKHNVSTPGPCQSNYIVLGDPQRLFRDSESYKWSSWLLWQTVLHTDKWLLKTLGCSGRFEGKLDSRLIMAHTWPYRNML